MPASRKELARITDGDGSSRPSSWRSRCGSRGVSWLGFRPATRGCCCCRTACTTPVPTPEDAGDLVHTAQAAIAGEFAEYLAARFAASPRWFTGKLRAGGQPGPSTGSVLLFSDASVRASMTCQTMDILASTSERGDVHAVDDQVRDLAVDVDIDKVDAAHHDAGQVGAEESRTSQVDGPELRTAELGALEARATQIIADEVSHTPTVTPTTDNPPTGGAGRSGRSGWRSRPRAAIGRRGRAAIWWRTW